MPEVISRVEMLQLHVSERKNVSVVYLSKDILFKCEVKKKNMRDGIKLFLQKDLVIYICRSSHK